jgi:hypothetical protein
MFSHPLDPPAVTAARRTELQHISRWIEEAAKPWQDQRERLDWWKKQQQQQQLKVIQQRQQRGGAREGTGTGGVMGLGLLQSLTVRMQTVAQRLFVPVFRPSR